MRAIPATRSPGPSVLYLIDSLAAGGAERSLVELAPHLVEAGVRLEVAVLHDRVGLAPDLQSAGIDVRVVGGTGRVQWLKGATDLIRSRRPDLVHTTLFESDLVGRAASVITRTPVVTTLASTPYGPEHASEPGIRRYRLRAAQLADAASARVVRRFHAVSQPTAAACIARLRLDPTKVDVIPRGRDLRRLGKPGPERAQRVRQQLGVGPSTPLALFVGRQEPAKGLDVLLNAMIDVLRRRPDLVLVVAGRAGQASAEARSIVERHRLQPAVRILGERSDVPDLLAAADVFVLPSYREGLPGAVLEAMAMQVPIVATDIPTVREAVPDDRFAILVPPGDPARLSEAIDRSLCDVAGARMRVDQSRLRFEERFDIEKVARSMRAFYARALAR